MSVWLRRRAAMWCALAMLLGGGWWFSSVRAQGEALPPAKTPVAAAVDFLALLENIENIENADIEFANRTENLYRKSISRAQRQKVEEYAPEAIVVLLQEVVSTRRNTQYDGKVVDQKSGKAIVELQKVDAATLPPVVCVAEDGGWRVDFFETYAKWKGLSDLERDTLVASSTGEISALVAANPEALNQLNRARENGRRASCQSNLKQVALGIAQYIQDYDEKLPPAREWADALQPYVKSREIFRCPNITDKNGFGYAYNARLSKKNIYSILDESQMVSIYETTDLKWNAYGMGEKPAFRHLGGANYAFTDGHVKWFDKKNIPQFTFRP